MLQILNSLLACLVIFSPGEIEIPKTREPVQEKRCVRKQGSCRQVVRSLGIWIIFRIGVHTIVVTVHVLTAADLRLHCYPTSQKSAGAFVIFTFQEEVIDIRVESRFEIILFMIAARSRRCAVGDIVHQRNPSESCPGGVHRSHGEPTPLALHGADCSLITLCCCSYVCFWMHVIDEILAPGAQDSDVVQTEPW